MCDFQGQSMRGTVASSCALGSHPLGTMVTGCEDTKAALWRVPYGEEAPADNTNLMVCVGSTLEQVPKPQSSLQMTAGLANILTETSGDILTQNHTAEGHLNSWPQRINVCCFKLLHFGVIWKTNTRRNCLNSHMPITPQTCL